MNKKHHDFVKKLTKLIKDRAISEQETMDDCDDKNCIYFGFAEGARDAYNRAIEIIKELENETN